MSKRIILILAFVLFFIEAAAVYWFQIGFSNTALREILYLAPPLFAVIGGIVALRTFGFTTNRSLTLIFLTAGVCFWFFGEILFAYYQYILQINPYPSAADMFYVLAYPLLFAGLVNEIRIARVNWNGIAKPTLFLFFLVSLLLAAIVGYFGIYQAYKPDEPLVANIIAIGYGIGDLLLILTNIFLLALIWEFRGGRLSRVWLILFSGFISTLIADILFAIYTMEYTMQLWFYKSLLDTFWIIGYLLFAVAFFEFSFAIQDAYQKVVLQAKEKGVPAQNTVTKPVS